MLIIILDMNAKRTLSGKSNVESVLSKDIANQHTLYLGLAASTIIVLQTIENIKCRTTMAPNIILCTCICMRILTASAK